MTIPQGLYAVITEKFCAGRSAITVLREVIAGGVKMVQLREKVISKRELYELALKYREITKAAKVLFIMNDHLDIAQSVRADGVHLGQDDFPIKAARVMAPGMIIGCSTHTLAEAKQAELDGASYINIGPIFATKTKETGSDGLGIAVIKSIKEQISIPFTVMGGIKEAHLASLLQAGASRIAMVTEITKAKRIKSKVSRMQKIILQN